MATFVLSFVLVALAVTGMAAGVLLGRRPISGSCGGLGSATCAACTRPCRRRRRDAQADDDAEAQP